MRGGITLDIGPRSLYSKKVPSGISKLLLGLRGAMTTKSLCAQKLYQGDQCLLSFVLHISKSEIQSVFNLHLQN